jgi:ubiquinone/menaquinone biosynthesis C-methylase UbiE
MSAMPYFDEIFARLEQPGSTELVDAFGARHVHWGYYADPSSTDDSVAGLQVAAEAMTRRLCDAANIRAGQQVLDVGCGFGGTIASLNERFSPLALTGLNIDPRQVERARTLVQAQPGNSVDFAEGDACRMPFAAASFERVLAVECIFHFPSRYRFFREASRVLKPGGRLTLCDFVPHGPTLPLLVPQFVAHGATIASFYGRSNPVPCTRAAYAALARITGFRLDFDEDVTRHTLPTYPVVRRLTRTLGHQPGERATAHTERFARSGLIRYRILSFERVG